MPQLVVYGNSGSGKSSLASKLAMGLRLAHLDLDTIAWQPGHPPEREDPKKSHPLLFQIINGNTIGSSKAATLT